MTCREILGWHWTFGMFYWLLVDNYQYWFQEDYWSDYKTSFLKMWTFAIKILIINQFECFSCYLKSIQDIKLIWKRKNDIKFDKFQS
jgi:hypothetical protein